MRKINHFGKLVLLFLALSGLNLAFGQYNGWFDSASCTTLWGWVEDSRIPNTPIYVDIYDGNSYVTSALANIYRQDVQNAGFGNGVHGFSITPPPSLQDGQAHNLYARPQGVALNLGGSPHSLTCANTSHAFGGTLDGAGCASIGGWAWDANNTGAAVSVSLYVDGSQTAAATATASTYRSDVKAAGYGTGYYGFTIATPSSLADGYNHSVSVRPTGTTAEVLYSSPRTLSCASSSHYYVGWLDGADCSTVHGWAADIDNQSVTQTVTVYVDGLAAQSGPANQYRGDVNAALGINGSFGFSIPSPSVLGDGQSHTVQVANSAAAGFLPGSGIVSLTCKPFFKRSIVSNSSLTFHWSETLNGVTAQTQPAFDQYITSADTLSSDVLEVRDYGFPYGFSIEAGLYSSPVSSGQAAPGNVLGSDPLDCSSASWSQHFDFNLNALVGGNVPFGFRQALVDCYYDYAGPFSSTTLFNVHVDSPATISSITPNQEVAGDSTNVTINGSGFGANPQVNISGSGVSVIRNSFSNTSISATMVSDENADTTAPRTVSVTANTLSNGFQHTGPTNPSNAVAFYLAPAPKISISSDQTVADGDPSATFSLSVLSGNAVSFQWSASWPSNSGNSPSVNFVAPTGQSTSTDAHWFANPDVACPSPSQVVPQRTGTYTVKGVATFDNGRSKSATAKLGVTVTWDPGGSTSGGTLDGSPLLEKVGDTWMVTSMGDLARKFTSQSGTRVAAPEVIINVSALSQFYGKIVAHEGVHRDQWNAGRIYGDLYDPGRFYATIKDLTATTFDDLNSATAAAFISFVTSEDAKREALRSAAEKEAYDVSDTLAPQYLYQNCGRFN